MDLIVGLLIALIVVGVVWWLCNYVFDNIPLPGPVAQIGKVIVTVLCVLYVVFKILLPLAHSNIF
jgi:hypothetical protein